ncbi:LysR substrate-binding domain-containing protein [Streptomyces sp. MZ04]|uniref:LysR family transcriptional regulator n=1 Tax=Streptomyces sp. MZ04 TaxID=2559236 RepID=UPI00107E8292|nr:LysR substrate-binding domain-containing protein [Streptomyces sp. MZ04]TGA91363.1 LysR family transcriptional regulator [Streptomyces sp. MZ04]
MQLNLHRLWIFMQVVEHHGFSAAAQKLYMSQPSVSNQVRKLEQSLRVPLIDRSGARTRPTAEGEVLAAYGKRVFLLADEAVAAVQQVSGLDSGRLLVGGSTTIGTYLLPPLLARYRELHPAIDCDVFVGNNEAVVERLLAGDIGIAVVAGTPTASQLVSETVLGERLVLIAGPRHPLASAGAAAGAAARPAVRPAVSPDELADCRFLLREPGSQTRELQEQVLDDWELRQVSRGDVWGPEALKQCVAAGLGVTLISEHAVVDDVCAGSLVVVPVTEPPRSRPVNLVSRRDRLLSPAERAFVDLLRTTDQWPRELPPASV